MNDAPDSAPAPGEYTIDDLAALTGVPSRTIRFYQARGVLPPPRKRGRVAYYDDSHKERLKVVGDLQDKGLRLRAIRDIVSRPDLQGDALKEWLGVGDRLSSLSSEAPALMSEEEIRQVLGDPAPGFLSRLVRKGRIQVQGEGSKRRYLIESPALLRLAARMLAAGIDIDTVIALHEILERGLGKMAHEIVKLAIARAGRGFGRSPEARDILHALEVLHGEGVGAEAVHLVFTQSLQREVNEALHDADRIPRRG